MFTISQTMNYLLKHKNVCDCRERHSVCTCVAFDQGREQDNPQLGVGMETMTREAGKRCTRKEGF